ncbi:MAG: cardiolipin synthase, partial [Bacillota bacterium]
NDKNAAQQANYISLCSAFPVYKKTQTTYFKSGQELFESLKQELNKAKHYIFMEYFILEEGLMWNSILEILAQKAKDGLDVRLIYDDAGCIKTLPYKYNEKLEEMGIKCRVFNPLKLYPSFVDNNRDHKKITVIDGHTGFCGGSNLADEYINKKEKYGHWKDADLMLKGDAVWSLTVMFLQGWNFDGNLNEDCQALRPQQYHEEIYKDDGYVQPFGDMPLDDEIVGEFAYINIINKAQDYVYINTPYLIIDNEMITALTLAAKNGVDVRIVTPYIGDRWYVQMVTRSYYQQLIDDGVKIYEYTPGFIHSKTFISDDNTAIIGAINMDYRSFYLHFESTVWMYKAQAIGQLKNDYLDTLKLCHEITMEDCLSVKWYVRLVRSFLKILAPLM